MTEELKMPSIFIYLDNEAYAKYLALGEDGQKNLREEIQEITKKKLR